MLSDSEEAQETFDILLDIAQTHDVPTVVATIRYLQERDNEVTAKTLTEALPNTLAPATRRRLLRHLRQNNYIGEEAESQRFHTLHQMESYLEVLQDHESGSRSKLVATLPEDDTIPRSEFGDLLTELLEIIKHTKRRLWIVSPFLSEDAYNRLRPALRTAARNDAQILLLTRYLTYGGEEGAYNRQFARALTDDNIIAPHLSLLEYINRETWVTFHAKVVLADRSTAYLGTANMTDVGLLTNLEIGMILKNDTAAQLAALFNSLQKSAYLHTVQRSGDSFYRPS